MQIGLLFKKLLGKIVCPPEPEVVKRTAKVSASNLRFPEMDYLVYCCDSQMKDRMMVLIYSITMHRDRLDELRNSIPELSQHEAEFFSAADMAIAAHLRRLSRLHSSVVI